MVGTLAAHSMLSLFREQLVAGVLDKFLRAKRRLLLSGMLGEPPAGGQGAAHGAFASTMFRALFQKLAREGRRMHIRRLDVTSEQLRRTVVAAIRHWA